MINSPEFQLTPSAMHHHMERAFYGGSNPRGGGVHPHTTHKAARPHHFGFSPPPQQQACFCTPDCLSHPALLLEYLLNLFDFEVILIAILFASKAKC